MTERLPDLLKRLNQEGTDDEAKVEAYLAAGGKMLRELPLLDLDQDSLRARMRKRMGEAVIDPDKAKALFRTKKARREWARQLRLWADRLDGAVKSLQTAASYFESNPANPEDSSGFSYDVSKVVRELQALAVDLRKDADAVERL